MSKRVESFVHAQIRKTIQMFSFSYGKFHVFTSEARGEFKELMMRDCQIPMRITAKSETKSFRGRWGLKRDQYGESSKKSFPCWLVRAWCLLLLRQLVHNYWKLVSRHLESDSIILMMMIIGNTCYSSRQRWSPVNTFWNCPTSSIRDKWRPGHVCKKWLAPSGRVSSSRMSLLKFMEVNYQPSLDLKVTTK